MLLLMSLLGDLDWHAQQAGDESEAEGSVGLALRRALPGTFEREVMRREGTGRLGHGAEALGAPDTPVVALAEEARQDAARAGDLAYQPEPGQQLEPVQRERNVADVTLSVGPQRVTQQLENGLQRLAAGENGERPARRGHREIMAQPLDEPGSLALHGGQEREHLHGEDAGRMGERVEHGL